MKNFPPLLISVIVITLILTIAVVMGSAYSENLNQESEIHESSQEYDTGPEQTENNEEIQEEAPTEIH